LLSIYNTKMSGKYEKMIVTLKDVINNNAKNIAVLNDNLEKMTNELKELRLKNKQNRKSKNKTNTV